MSKSKDVKKNPGEKPNRSTYLPDLSILLFAAVFVIGIFAAAAGYGKAKSVYHNILNTIHSESERIIDTMEAHHYNFDNSWGGEEGSRLLSHALGGIDGKTYTNS